jgi:transposase-like protein
MTECSPKVVSFPQESAPNPLEEVLRQGAQQLLRHAIEQEVAEYLAAREDLLDAEGRRQVVRNGYLPAREIQTPLGGLPVQQPRVRDRREAGEREVFRSQLLPPYLRRTKSIEELIPWLYLKGVSTGDFSEALQALLGVDAAGLSATTITRLKAGWQQDFEAWSRRSLRTKNYVYLWADGVYFNVRLESPENQRQCILVLIGATAEGRKELVAVVDGVRESEASWREILLDLKHRGLEIPPKLAIGDGAMGFWAALSKVYPTTRHQRCWVHKTSNLLNCFPKAVQPRAKQKIQAIWMAETQADALKAFDAFVETYEAKYPKATASLEKDRDALLAFYDFPAEHWRHIRTSNPIESTFATVRLRTQKTKGSGSRIACLTMVHRLCLSAQKKWRALNGAQLLADVVQGTRFQDGIKQAA